MAFTITKKETLFKTEKHGISLDVYPNIGDCGFVIVDTETGHNQEFYDTKSTFHYVIIEGHGDFYLDDEKIVVQQGDLLSIEPNTRIYYKGNMKLVLITNPSWAEQSEVETKPTLW